MLFIIYFSFSKTLRSCFPYVTIPIAEEIVQSEKRDLEDIEKTNSIFQNEKDDNGATLRNKAYNLYTDGKDAGPSPLQIKIFQKNHLKQLLSHQIQNHLIFMTLL